MKKLKTIVKKYEDIKNELSKNINSIIHKNLDKRSQHKKTRK